MGKNVILQIKQRKLPNRMQLREIGRRLNLCPFSGLPIKPTRLFGHRDEISKDHHGPTSRWEKQRRRRGAKARREARRIALLEARARG